jgi:hypothetical protein
MDNTDVPGSDTQPLDDRAIIVLLESAVQRSTGQSFGRLSRDDGRVAEYLYGDRPFPPKGQTSSYVSTDVWDGHQMMSAQLLDTFSANNRPVVFAPVGANDVDDAQAATEAVTHEIYNLNPAFEIFQSVISDALSCRKGIAKVIWKEDKQSREFDLPVTDETQLSSYLVQHPEAKLEEVVYDKDDLAPPGAPLSIKRAVISVVTDRSRVEIIPMPPEKFGVEARATSLDGQVFCYHKDVKTYSELLDEGYKKSQIDLLASDDDLWENDTTEVYERFRGVDDGFRNTSLIGQLAGRRITVYECYALLDMEGTGRSRYWQVIYAGNEVLHKEQVSEHPFVDFNPLPKPHATFGVNFDGLLVQTQIVRSNLIRAIDDHTRMTTNPRWQIKNGALKNPRELFENRIGGGVNVQSTIDSIAPLPVAPLNPFVFQVIGLLDDDKEQRTGISRLSQGLNRDAISNQNSQGMVQDLITVSQVRQKVVARNFASFLRRLYLRVYKLLLENAPAQREIEVAGSWSTVDVSSWPERTRVNVAFALGYGEQAKEVQKWLGVDKILGSDPRLAPQYGIAQRDHVLRCALQASGIQDTQRVLADPNTVKPPQPSPMDQADLAVKQSDATVKQANAQAAVKKLDLDAQKELHHFTLEQAKLQIEMARVQIERDKLNHMISRDAAEIAMEKQAAAAGTAKVIVDT